MSLQTCQDCPNTLVCCDQGKCYRKSFRAEATTAASDSWHQRIKKFLEQELPAKTEDELIAMMEEAGAEFSPTEDGYCWNCGEGFSDHGEDLECKNTTP